MPITNISNPMVYNNLPAVAEWYMHTVYHWITQCTCIIQSQQEDCYILTKNFKIHTYQSYWVGIHQARCQSVNGCLFFNSKFCLLVDCTIWHECAMHLMAHEITQKLYPCNLGYCRQINTTHNIGKILWR